MMSGNSPDDGSTTSITANLAAPAVSINRAALDVVADFDSAPTSTVEDDSWERFKSTSEFENWLIEAATEEWGHLFGTTTHYLGMYPYWTNVVLRTTPTLGGPVFFAFGAGITDSDTTNVHVAGVDEADLIETDGEYLYIISGKSLVIVEAGEGDNLRVVSRLELDGRPVDMYVIGDRLAIVSSKGGWSWETSNLAIDIDASSSSQYLSESTIVTVLDIQDRSSPKLVQKTELDGQLVASRVVDDELRLVLNSQFHLPQPIARKVENTSGAAAPKYVEAYPQFVRLTDSINADWWYPTQWDATYVYETKEEYIARVKDELLESIAPQIRSLAIDGTVIEETPLLDATELIHSSSRRDRSVTTVATFDLSSDEAGPIDRTSVLTSGATQVYATEDSLYLFAQQSQQWDGLWLGNVAWGTRTNVWKFSFDGDTHAVDIVAKGAFNGSVLNQFAADERDGYLRMVTTSGSWGVGSNQSVLVMAQHGRKLDVVGRVDGIAGGEVLYSVRFAGDKAYFVTFRKVDPLFVVDLSVPTNPRMMGELHIPGYSDYLQPIDENHLLAIGRGADENTGLFQELQVSIFDVSDMDNPLLVDRYSFDGGRSTVTPATGDRWTRGDGDHHAVSYYAGERILTLPIQTADWWQDETGSIFDVGKGGLQVFRIDVDTGLTPLGIIEHDALVERSVQFGDHLFAISSGTVTVHELANPNNKLGELEIGGDSSAAFTELEMYLPIMSTLMETKDNLLPATSNSTMRVVDPRAGWALPDLARSRHAQPARVIAFANLAGAPHLDTELVQLLAIQSAGRDDSANAEPGNSRFATAGVEDDAVSAADYQGLSDDIHACVLELL